MLVFGATVGFFAYEHRARYHTKADSLKHQKDAEKTRHFRFELPTPAMQGSNLPPHRLPREGIIKFRIDQRITLIT